MISFLYTMTDKFLFKYGCGFVEFAMHPEKVSLDGSSAEEDLANGSCEVVDLREHIKELEAMKKAMKKRGPTNDGNDAKVI